MNLAPLRGALLATAEDEADTVVLAAGREASSELSAAEAQVTELVARARAEAEAAAGREAARIVGRARSEAVQVVLGAQRDVYDELCTRVREAALELRRDPAYGALLERLQAIARAELGEDATLEVDPPLVGGVRGVSGSRRIDLSLPALAERCLATRGPELEALWR